MYPTKDAFEDDDFLFPKVVYISFLAWRVFLEHFEIHGIFESR